MSWLSRFYPDETADSSYVIDYEKKYREGCRGLIYDIDNTLVPHDAPADERAIELFRHLHGMGFSTYLLSNNDRKRVAPFAEALDTPFLCMAAKPAKGGYRKACELMQLDIRQVIFIGDQLFTDVWGAKRVGMHNILVKPINPKEEIQIVLKRKLEKIVLRQYEKDREAGLI